MQSWAHEVISARLTLGWRPKLRIQFPIEEWNHCARQPTRIAAVKNGSYFASCIRFSATARVKVGPLKTYFGK